MPSDDFYDDEPVAAKGGSGDSDGDAGTSASPTMLSRTVLGGRTVKPGDTITLRVTRVYDDELGVEATSGGGDEESEAPEGDAEEAPAAPPAELGEEAPAGVPATDDMYV